MNLALFVLLLIASAAPTIAAGTANASAKPNFVIIFIDDLGYADIGPFGATKQRTPNLDRMASQGIKLTSFYAAPVCSVSRAQLLTGCYGARVSVPGVYFPAGKNGLNPAESTIAERLKERNYATVCIGKWHLGDQPEFLPTRQGFDRYFGIPYSNDMQRKPEQGSANAVPLLRDEKVAELLTDEQQRGIVERYTDEAIAFLHEKRDAPFFLYLAHTAVHTPIHPGPKFAGKSGNGRFGDWVEEVDWSVGRVLDTLRELKLDERTMVLFTSDNGPWLVKGSDGGSAGPLRNGKGSTWEGGVRVPTIAWWPGRIQAGTVSDAVAGTIDVLPTLVSLSGGRLPAEPIVDGRDISPLLLGKSKTSPREAHYYFSGYNLQAVRQGSWKLAIAPQPGLDEPAAKSSTQTRLYNLDAEIGERTDLANQHPEVVAKLRALAERMNAEIGGNQPSARRPAGEVANPKPLYPMAPTAQPANSKRSNIRTAPLHALKPGDALSSAEAPQVANRGFEVSCTIETTQPDGIILAHGGLVAGYTLHIKDGRVAFAVRTGGGEAITQIVTGSKVTSPASVRAGLEMDGTMTLKINSDPAVTGKSPRLIPRQPAENFCIGHDDAQAVAAYASRELFQGKIRDLKIGLK